jgi:hypothetical protein
VGAYNSTKCFLEPLKIFISAVNANLCIVMVTGVQVLKNVGETARDLWCIDGIRETI